MQASRKVRTYLDDVPEAAKEQISRSWGERKTETYVAAERRDIKLKQGKTFNKVVAFELDKGFYHMSSGIVSAKDTSPKHSDVGALCSGLVSNMVAAEKERHCTPLFASNVCDWDSGYANEVGASISLRDSVIDVCIENRIVLTGGETANLGDQIGKKGMSWMFTLLSRYDGSAAYSKKGAYSITDGALSGTFGCVADARNFEIVNCNGMPLLKVNKKSRFMMTADGTGSKSMVCNMIGKRADIEDTLAMCCDDATRDGAFPVVASIGVHIGDSMGKSQIIDNMRDAGKKHSIPLIGCVFHASDDVNTYIMNGVALSAVRERPSVTASEVLPRTELVLLYEEQRSNGITTQRKVLEETFGKKWHGITASRAFDMLNEKLGGKQLGGSLSDEGRTLGELVAQPSTPYFRIDSAMPAKILDTIKFRINVSSGGMIGKTSRFLEPFGVGANYSDVFEAPNLILLLQMASRLEGSKGVISDKIAYSTWGCGNGVVIGTTDPAAVIKYYGANGIRAKVGGCTTSEQEISITSKCLDSITGKGDHVINHKYTEKPTG